MTNNLNAYGPFVLVQLDPRPNQSMGGVLYSQYTNIPRNTGTVLSAGKKARDIESGDRVFFRGCDPITDNDPDTVCVHRDNIYAVYPSEENRKAHAERCKPMRLGEIKGKPMTFGEIKDLVETNEGWTAIVRTNDEATYSVDLVETNEGWTAGVVRGKKEDK